MQHSKEMTVMKTRISKKYWEPVILNDHHAMGIIDVFAKNLKRVLSKEFLENKSTKWIDILPKIIEQYNNTPHTAPDNTAPNEEINDP